IPWVTPSPENSRRTSPSSANRGKSPGGGSGVPRRGIRPPSTHARPEAIHGHLCHARLPENVTPHSACRARIRRVFSVDTPDRVSSPYPQRLQRCYRGPTNERSTTRAGLDGAPPICQVSADPAGDAPIPHGQNSTARPKAIFGAYCAFGITFGDTWL